MTESAPLGLTDPVDLWVAWGVITRAGAEACALTGATGRERVWRSVENVLLSPLGSDEATMTHRLLDAGWLIAGPSGTFEDLVDTVPGRRIVAPRYAQRWARQSRWTR